MCGVCGVYDACVWDMCVYMYMSVCIQNKNETKQNICSCLVACGDWFPYWMDC